MGPGLGTVSEPGDIKEQGPRRWIAAAVALLLVVAVFPDVVFLGASFRNSRLLRIFDNSPETVSWGPQTVQRKIWEGYRDLGSAAWQLEPAQRFLGHCIREGESPYWNPYCASGTHGPERLVSASFSLITVATALLGAGTLALHAVLLTTFVLAVYCLFRCLTVYLRCSVPAAVAGCFVFLLAGFHVSMIGAQMVQPYLLAPVLLLALLALAEAPTPWRWVVAILANAAVLLETFLPTTVLILVGTHLFSLVYAADAGRWDWRPAGRRWLLQMAAPLVAFLLVAPLWFPILDSVGHADWSEYGQRDFETARARVALSVLSPQHFWDSYRGYSRNVPDDVLSFVRHGEATRIYHLGLVACFVAVQALGAGRPRRPMVWVAAGCMAVALGRTFGVLPFRLIEHLPVFGLINLQYWGALLTFPFCILVAEGFDSLSSATVRHWPSLALFATVIACVGYLTHRLGVPQSAPVRVHLAVLLGLVGVVVALSVALALRPRWRRGIAALLLLLLVGELVLYMNRVRPVRREIDEDTVGDVAFVRRNLRVGERIMNIGNRGIYPNWGSALEVPQIDSLDGVNLLWYARFFDERFGSSKQFLTIRGQRRRQVDAALQAARLDPAALDLLAVRYALITSGMVLFAEHLQRHGWREAYREPGILILENPGSLRRAFVVGGLIEAPGIPSDWHLPARHVATTVDRDLITAARALGVPTEAAEVPAGSAGDVWVREVHHARVVLDAELRSPGVVVLADTWHPGWTARVDGEAAHMARVDDVVRGMVLPAGSHHIEMRYRPRTLRPALLISALTAILLLGTVVVASRFGGRQRPEAGAGGTGGRRLPQST